MHCCGCYNTKQNYTTGETELQLNLDSGISSTSAKMFSYQEQLHCLHRHLHSHSVNRKPLYICSVQIRCMSQLSV